MVDQVFEHLADIGDSLNASGDQGFRPRLAQTMGLEFRFAFNRIPSRPSGTLAGSELAFSNNVRYTYRLYTDSLVGAPIGGSLQGIDSVSVPDSLTAVFWFKRRYPRQFFDATAQMLICPAHLLSSLGAGQLRNAPFSHHPVGSGRFRLAWWTAGATLELVADTANYRGRPGLDRVVLIFSPDFGAAMVKVLGGEADFYEGVRPENLPEIARVKTLRVLTYPNPAYSYLLFNLRQSKPGQPHSLFATPDLRRALAMSVDRERIVRSVFDTFAVVARGPFASEDFNADPGVAQVPYDPVRSNRLLDSLR